MSANDALQRYMLLTTELSEMMIMNERQRRRNRLLRQKFVLNANKMFFKHLLNIRKSRKPRTIWMKSRNSTWWTDTVMKKFDDKDWIANFRVDKETFFEICDMVRADLEPKPTKFRARPPISVEKQVAVALYKFASCAEYRIIGNNMGISKCSVHKCVRRFTFAMLKHTASLITMPTETEAEQISAKFEKICHIPQVLLIIDGTHVPILAPVDGHGDFVNRKGWTSYNVQIVADANYIIRDVSCRFPGASHDAYVLKESGFFQNINDLLPKKTKIINGTEVGYLVLGDPAYPLMDWLLKGYTGRLDPLQESFNAYMNTARIIIEQTIGKLKSRWRILKKINDMDYRFVPKVVIVCCMLHNLVQRKKISLPDFIELADDSLLLDQPMPQNMERQINRSNNFRGEAIRNAVRTITDSLPLRQQINLNRR